MAPPQVVRELAVPFDQWLELADLPGETLRLAVDVRPSLLGKLKALAIGAPAVWCEVAGANGRTNMYRLIPRIVSEGVLVRPHVLDQDRAVQMFCGDHPPGLARVRLRVPDEERVYWQPSVQVRILRQDGLVPKASQQTRNALRFPMFDPPPLCAEFALPFSLAEFHGNTVGLCHAPSSFAWSLAPGHYRLDAGFGLMDGSWQGDKGTDGAGFSVSLQPENGQATRLLRRVLDPRQKVEDRGLQRLQLKFDVAASSLLVLRCDRGDGTDVGFDWCFWSGASLRSE